MMLLERSLSSIIFVRHAHAFQDHLTSKGISQIRSSLKGLDSFYKPELKIVSSPAERCEHTAWFISTHLSVPGYVDENLGEPVTDEKVCAALDALPDCCMAITHSDFIRKAIAKLGGTFLNYIPNVCLLKITGNHLDDMAVFYEDDSSD
jgi:phosphohistidine phosphatase SixA